ncbi:MAG: hypothetical protein QOF70_1183 [Acetobacteraceae bacterium]|jgi:hypothetical protein|nr:hypothetical protein [Acetobacteraceae bacterium]
MAACTAAPGLAGVSETMLWALHGDRTDAAPLVASPRQRHIPRLQLAARVASYGGPFDPPYAVFSA